MWAVRNKESHPKMKSVSWSPKPIVVARSPKKSPKSVKKGATSLKVEPAELDIVKKEQTSDFYTEGQYITTFTTTVTIKKICKNNCNSKWFRG